jgi:putative transposase
MLLPRDVIRYGGDQTSHLRVIWADQKHVVLFDLDADDTRLIRRDRTDITSDLRAGAAELVLDHAFDKHQNPAKLTEAQKKRRTKLFGILEPLLARAPDIFDDRLRGRAVADIERAGKASAKTVHKAIDRYWRYGLSENALTPDFSKCGRGERKPGEIKLGRRPAAGKPIGTNITPEIEAIFDKGLNRFFVSNRKNSLKAAYDLTVAEFFVDEVIDPTSGRKTLFPRFEFSQTGYPSFRQFGYWYSKRDDVLKIRRKRAGGSKYDKDMRGIVGTAVAGLMGAGSRFEIDSTPLDIGCVSEVDRTIPVGRPTFYQATDVLTKMVAGIYVGFENASWMAAGLVVRNIVENKVEFCARYGVEIEPEQWPIAGVLPARFMADRGEFEGFDATEFVSKSTVTVELAAPYRGDQKGSTEKKFDQFHKLLQMRLDGMIEKQVSERGDADYRRDAILTLPEVTACVIEVAIFLNNHNKLVDYPRTREMIAERVRAIPVEMWRWCRDRGMDELTRASVSAVEFAMLPVKNATVTPRGYKYRDLYYRPSDRRAYEIFDHARQGHVKAAPISVHPLRTTNVYLHDANALEGFVTLELTDLSAAYADISFDEASALMKSDDVDTANQQIDRSIGMARMSRNTGTINSSANAGRKRKLTAAEAQGHKGHRVAELDRERSGRTSGLYVKSPEAPNVTPIGDALKGRGASTAPNEHQNEQEDYLP